MVPVRHVAIANRSTLASDRDVAFWAEAARLQLQRHAAPLWGEPPPGVMFYARAEELAEDEAAVLIVSDDDGDPAAAGYHTDLAGRVFGVVDVGQSRSPSRTMSHELLELYGNPQLDRWTDGPGGRGYAVELCDPVQRDSYTTPVTLFGETRMIELSDFVLRRWFAMRPVNPADPRTTYLDQPLAEFQTAPGGYQVAQDPDGSVLYLSRGEMAVSRSAHSRTDRIRRRR